MPRTILTVDEIMSILGASVARLAALTQGLSPAQVAAPPEPGEWSVKQLLAHLRAAQDVLGRNIQRIVAEDRPAWRRVSPREWQRKSGYDAWEFQPAFDAFGDGRADLLAFLEPLTSDDWDRVALVTVAPDRTVEQSARFFGDWLAGHERDHFDQLEQTARVVRNTR